MGRQNRGGQRERKAERGIHANERKKEGTKKRMRAKASPGISWPPANAAPWSTPMVGTLVALMKAGTGICQTFF